MITLYLYTALKMKITVKSMSTEKYEFDVTTDMTVLALKELLKEKGYDPELTKLIYAGKILLNENTLGFYNLKENDFVVAMKSKAKPPNPAPTPVNAPSLPPIQVQQQPPVVVVPPVVAVPPVVLPLVQNIVAQNPVADQPTNPPNVQQNQQVLNTNDLVNQTMNVLAQNPQLLMQIMMQSPSMQELAHENPEAIEEMVNNPEIMMGMMGAAMNMLGDNPVPDNQPTITLTPDDANNLTQLETQATELGYTFKKHDMLEAYFACDKNIDLALNFLLEK